MSEKRVEGRERGEVDWVVGVDGEGLLGEGAQTEMDGLEGKALLVGQVG